MKRCPVCSRTYSDDQNFCFDDGTTLAAAPVSPIDISQAPTANYPYRSGAPPTNVMQGTPTTGGRPYGTSPPPPPAFMMPYAQPKRSPLPWIIGGLLVLIVGIAAILFISKRNSGQTTTNTSGTTPAASPSYSPTTTMTPTTTSSSSWQAINEDGFTISMPGTPSKNDDTVPSAAGPLMLRMYTLSQGYEGYITGYTEYPDMVFTASNPEDMMDGAQRGAINNVQGEVTSQRKITVNGNPGREIVGSSPSKNIGFTARVILARPRMYMLVYTQYDKSKPMSDDGKRFLDSFKITK
jgi:hypothetical protein